MKVIRTNIDGFARKGGKMFSDDAYELFRWLDEHVGPRNVAWNAQQQPTDRCLSIILWDEKHETMFKLRWS